MTDVIKQGKKPVFHFLCKLCNHEWNECYLEGSAMITVEMVIAGSYRSSMRCPCCGLAVWSDVRGKVEEGDHD